MHSLNIVTVLMMCSLWLLGAGNKIELPAGIKQCAIMDDVCIMNSAQYVLQNYGGSGIKELGLVKLDPLHIKKLSLAKNLQSPVSVDLAFSEVDLIGLKAAQIKRVSGFTRDFSKPIELDLFAPRIVLKGPYVVDGKVLILPIVGKGDAEIVLENAHFGAKLKLKKVSKGDGQTYIEVTSLHLSMAPGHVLYNLQNLFNGNQELGDAVLTLVNQNWSDVFSEIKGDMSKALGLIFKSVLNRALSKHPLEWLFSDV